MRKVAEVLAKLSSARLRNVPGTSFGSNFLSDM